MLVSALIQFLGNYTHKFDYSWNPTRQAVQLPLFDAIEQLLGNYWQLFCLSTYWPAIHIIQILLISTCVQLTGNTAHSLFCGIR